MPETRKHAAIMFTDIVGYTKLMGSDEEKAVDMLTRNRSIHQSCIEKFNGTLIKEIGDGMLASFNLASEAVRCAMEIEKQCNKQDIPLKIGILKEIRKKRRVKGPHDYPYNSSEHCSCK